MKKIILFFLVGIVAITVGAGTRYFTDGVDMQKTAVVSAGPVDCGSYSAEEFSISVSGNVEGNEQGVQGSVNASGDVKAFSEGSEYAQQCFEQKFAACSPAFIHAQLPLFGMEFRYEIKGAVEGGCSIVAEYTKNPEVALIGPKAFCTYNSGNPFFDVESKKLLEVCTGPLIDKFNTQTTTTPEGQTSVIRTDEKKTQVVASGPKQCGTAYLVDSGDGSGKSVYRKEDASVAQCFESNLQKACSPASMRVSVASLLLFEYRIVKQINIDDCQVEVRAIESSEPELRNTSMLCQVNARSVVEDGLAEAEQKKKCAGSLSEALK